VAGGVYGWCLCLVVPCRAPINLDVLCIGVELGLSLGDSGPNSMFMNGLGGAVICMVVLGCLLMNVSWAMFLLWLCSLQDGGLLKGECGLANSESGCDNH